MNEAASKIDGLLVLPHLRIQNANAISSPLTWGFPAISAFLGLMQAVERRMPVGSGLRLVGVGVVCHDFQAQTTRQGYTQAFHLTRNPIDKDGSTPGIVEEGRIHLDLTIVFGVVFEEGFPYLDTDAQAQLGRNVSELVAGLRVAGGSVLPALRDRRQRSLPRLVPLGDDADDREKVFLRERRRWLPGFALVSRDDLLAQRVDELRKAIPQATALDAWLDLSRLNYRAEQTTRAGNDADVSRPSEESATVEWTLRRPPGWIVPIPVGYGVLSTHAPGTVSNSRDPTIPFCFVESLYSIGQWVSPHRLDKPSQLLWHADSDIDTGVYRCVNAYASPAAAADFESLDDF